MKSIRFFFIPCLNFLLIFKDYLSDYFAEGKYTSIFKKFCEKRCSKCVVFAKTFVGRVRTKVLLHLQETVC